MQFLTISRRRTERFTDIEFAARRAEEVAQARALYASGFIRQIWHRADVGGACIVVEADSEEQVREQLNTLPLVGSGMLEVTIIPLRPLRWVRYNGLARAPAARRKRISLREPRKRVFFFAAFAAFAFQRYCCRGNANT